MLSKAPLRLLEAASSAPASCRGKGRRGVQAASGFLRAHFIHRKSADTPSSPPLAQTACGTSGSPRKSLPPWPRPLPGWPLLTQPVLMTTLRPELCHLHPERRPVGGSADAPMMPPLCALCPLLFLPGCSLGALPSYWLVVGSLTWWMVSGVGCHIWLGTCKLMVSGVRFCCGQTRPPGFLPSV